MPTPAQPKLWLLISTWQPLPTHTLLGTWVGLVGVPPGPQMSPREWSVPCWGQGTHRHTSYPALDMCHSQGAGSGGRAEPSPKDCTGLSGWEAGGSAGWGPSGPVTLAPSVGPLWPHQTTPSLSMQGDGPPESRGVPLVQPCPGLHLSKDVPKETSTGHCPGGRACGAQATT